MSDIAFKAVLRALELRGVRLGAGRGVRGPMFAFGGADGELRAEAWAICPACGDYGLCVERLDDGGARVSCRERCGPEEILVALAAAVVERVAA